MTLWTAAHQAPLSMGFSRQEYWSELLCPPPGDLPNPRIEPRSPTLQVNFLPSEPPRKPNHYYKQCLKKKKKKHVDISHFFPLLSLWNSVCVLNLQISQFKQAAFPVLCSHMWLGGYQIDSAALENKSEGLQWKQQPSLEATAKVQWDKHCSD